MKKINLQSKSSWLSNAAKYFHRAECLFASKACIGQAMNQIWPRNK